jgi:hypothetical protein
MGMNLSAFTVSELRARGLTLSAFGVLLGALDAVLYGTGRLAEVIVAAVIFGALMYVMMQSAIGSVLAQAGAVRAAVSEPAVDTHWRAVSQLAPLALALLLVDLAVGHVATLAGMPLGAGLALLVDSVRLRTWEGLNALRLLHQVPTAPSRWPRWLGVPDPADYALCAQAGVKAAVTPTSAGRI